MHFARTNGNCSALHGYIMHALVATEGAAAIRQVTLKKRGHAILCWQSEAHSKSGNRPTLEFWSYLFFFQRFESVPFLPACLSDNVSGLTKIQCMQYRDLIPNLVKIHCPFSLPQTCSALRYLETLPTHIVATGTQRWRLVIQELFHPTMGTLQLASSSQKPVSIQPHAESRTQGA